MISCDVCNFQCESKAKLIVHINLTHPKQKMEEDFNCDKCAFQGTTQLQLNKHLNLKHLFTEQKKEVIKCRHCDQQFSETWNLMNHRKLKHIETVAYCKNSLEGKCTFTHEMCWWTHNGNQHSKEEEIECFICNNTFETKSSMMRHRKISHPSVIRQCNNFVRNMCKFQNSSCWFRHVEQTMETNENGSRAAKENPEEMETNEIDTKAAKENLEEEFERDLVFQKAFMNTKPPIKKQNKEKTD